MPLRIVLADDNFLVREGVKLLIESASDLELVATCGDYAALLWAVDEHDPDVVVTDIRMPPGGSDEGIRAAEELRGSHPTVGVLVLSAFAEPAYALRLLEGGSSGRAYLLKDRVADIDQLVDAIRAVADGGSVIDPRVVETLVAAQSTRRASRLDKLTPRELEVLGEIAQGKNNAAIAGSLFLTERAVEKHINAIFAKLGLSHERDTNRRVRAVLLYLDERATTE
jgi:DNA-binding NarL/FixJ family response regulator